MTDLEVVDNLDSSIDLKVDNLGVNTDTGVDLDLEVGTLEVDNFGVDTLEVAILEVAILEVAILEVDIDTEVDPGVHIEAEVDLEVAPQTQMVYLAVAPQALIEAAPQAVVDHLEVEKRELNLTSCKCPLHPMVYYHCFQLITHDQWVEEMLPQRYQKVTDTRWEQKDRRVRKIQEIE